MAVRGGGCKREAGKSARPAGLAGRKRGNPPEATRGHQGFKEGEGNKGKNEARRGQPERALGAEGREEAGRAG